jgi:hypothetical protein
VGDTISTRPGRRSKPPLEVERCLVLGISALRYQERVAIANVISSP